MPTSWARDAARRGEWRPPAPARRRWPPPAPAGAGGPRPPSHPSHARRRCSTRRAQGSPRDLRRQGFAGHLGGSRHPGPRSRAGRWRRGTRGSGLGPGPLDQFRHRAAVTLERRPPGADRCHPSRPPGATGPHRVLGEPTQQPAARPSPAPGLHVDRPRQIVRQRDQHLCQGVSMPGIARSPGRCRRRALPIGCGSAAGVAPDSIRSSPQAAHLREVKARPGGALR